MATTALADDFEEQWPDLGGRPVAGSCEAKNRLAWLLKQLAALAWPVLLGYSEAEPLVRNSHMVGSHRKSHMRLIGGWSSHHWSDCHQHWPLESEVTEQAIVKKLQSCNCTRRITSGLPLDWLSQCVTSFLSSDQNSARNCENLLGTHLVWSPLYSSPYPQVLDMKSNGTMKCNDFINDALVRRSTV